VNFYAQTNVQLFNQLRNEGYANEEVARIGSLYAFAMRLFTGFYQPSGKPAIDHLIGTASILASLHRPVEVVAAGLLHAAYLHGDFGDLRFRRVISHAKRDQLKQAVGEEVEEFIARYTALLWTRQTIPLIRDHLTELGPIDRDVLVMRLANELELHLDLAPLYYRETKNYQQALEQEGPPLIDLADKLGFSTLATELARTFREIASGEVPLELRSRSIHFEAYLIPPQSYRQRLPVAIGHQLIRGLDRVRKLSRKTKKKVRALLPQRA